MVWIFFFVLLTVFLILCKLQYYKAGAWEVTLTILLTSCYIGGIAAASIGEYLAPYFFFGAERVRSEKIKVTGLEGGRYEEGKYVFSNGESIPSDSNRGLNIIMQLTFLLVGGGFMLSGMYFAKFLAKKFSPGMYKEFSGFLPAKKS